MLSIDKKKHILVISQYFYPEQFRINDICLEWIKRGYDVTVLTGIPNYPQGEFYEGYGYDENREELWNGIHIIRLPIKPRKTGSLNLIKNYFSFVFEGYKWVRKTKLVVDFVYTYEVSPMTQALVGVSYSKKYGIPHYLYVTDLWPHNVEIITGISNKFVIYPIQLMVDYIYKNSNKIFTSSKSFIAEIEKRNVSREKLEFWPQYAEEFYKPIPNNNNLPSKNKVFNMVFAGNIGYGQGLGILVKAADLLRKENIKVLFTIIGEGRFLHEFKEQIEELNLQSYFLFLGRKQPEDIPIYFSTADALLITLAKSKVFSMTIPAKTQSCLACGKPILLSADGEVQKIVLDANAGLVSNAEDVLGFSNNIKEMLSMNSRYLENLGKNASIYSNKYFNKEVLLRRLDDVFYRLF